MDFCIDEWATGVHVPKDLSIADMQKRYTRQKKSITTLGTAAFGRLVTLKKNIYNFGV
jgi:hypothetical protein